MRCGSCSQFAPTASAPPSAIARAHSAGVWPSLQAVTSGRKLIVATTGRPLSAAASSADLHLGEVEEGLENQEIDARVLEEPDLLGDVIPGRRQRAALALDQLGAGHAAGDESPRPGDLPGERHGRRR